ncbi:MAG: hypothetical protein KDC98_13270 [Planctomycetes bacterium]|nr:hypothetical protein [Planctomycetota bacterium]
MPVHPFLVHFPLALAGLMPLLAGGLLLAWWRGWLRPRGWMLVVALQGTLVLTGFVAMKAGERDEERVERVVSERAIEHHEEAAEVFVWSGALLLLLSVAPLLLRSERAARFAALGFTLASPVVLGFALRAGESGGELVYRHGAAAAFAGRPAPGDATPRWWGGDDDDDDDR